MTALPRHRIRWLIAAAALVLGCTGAAEFVSGPNPQVAPAPAAWASGAPSASAAPAAPIGSATSVDR